MGKDDSDDDTEALASTGVKLETPAKEAAPSGGQMSTEEREAREAKVEAERAAAQPTKLAGYNASHIGSRANLAHVRKESRANLNILPPTASKAVLGIDNPQAVGDAPATDQSLRDAAEIDNPDDTSIWEHTLVVEDEGKADFSALLKCPIAQKYDWSVEEGLSKGKAEEALAEFGENRLTPPEKLPEWIKFLLHLVGGFSLLLWGGAILCFVVYAINSAVDNLYLGIVLAVVVTATGIFSYMQEAKADATMEAFAKMAPEQVYCYRKGDQKIDEDREKMDATKLVPGDLIKVQLGDKVPADILMIRVDDFKVNNSALTGEPDPLERLTWCTDDDLMETKNVAFFGTFCEQGNCIGLVLRTGDQTRMGQIAADAADDDGSETLMQMEIRHFIHIVSACAGVLGIVFFIIAIPKYGIVDAFVFMIGIIVANVPEGLLATVTVALTLTAKTMATHQVLVKNMETIETLGSITTIASDKTGTLTQNRMAANHAVYDYQLKAVDAVMVAGEKKDMAFQANDPSFQALQRCATLCGSAKFCKYDEKMGEPKHWDSFSGKPGMGGKENQENDYQSFYHYVPYTKDDDEPVSFRTICDRIGWKVDNDVPFKAEAKDGEYMRWRNPDMAFRAYKDGNATDAGLMKFGEARVEDVYSTFADAADDEDVKRSLKSTVVKDSQGQETDMASYCEKYRKHWSQIAQIPFNSSNKFMVTVHNVPRQDTDVLQERQALLSTSNIEDDGEDYVVLMMKGAAERVADKCSTALFQGKPVDPKVYYGMLNGKMSTADDMTKAKNEEDRLQADQLSDEQKVLEKRKIFNFQTTIANSHEDDFVSNADVQTWTQKMDQIQDITGGSLVQGSPSSETATSLMKNPKSNTLKYHQQSLAVEGERVLAFAQLVAKKSDLISKGILIETGAAIEIDHERPEVEKALGFASADHDGAEYAWTYLGMVSLVDPPRDAVPAAVESCRTASIQVVMVTGDHPLTAKSIATRIKIIQGDTWREFERGERIAQGKDPDLITEKEMFESYSHHEWFGLLPRYKKVKGCAVFGPTIHNFTDDDWRYTLRLKELVFARTQPEQKKEIVGKMKNLHELNLDALDQLHACKQLLQSKRDLVEIRTKLGEHFTSIEEQTDKKKKEHREKCVKAGKKTSGSDYNDDMDKIDEEGKQDKKKVAQAYLDTSDHDFRMATFLMLPVRAKELHDKLQGDSTADSLIQEIDALVDRETKRNNQPKVVAVTGDGVNDSPALKAADCGIAMGIAGADVAKENADMILLDDNFASIVQGIEQGRLIFDNLKKSIAYTLTSNIPEITPFLALIIFQIPIPLETVMILCIDLGTDMLPAISLAYEEPEGGIMKRAPRDKSCDRLVNSKLIFMAYGQIGMIQAAAGFACYFLVFDHYGLSYDDIVNTGFDYKDDGVATVAGLNYDTRVDILRKAQTSFLVSIVVAQWADVIICKTRERTIFEQGMTNMVLNVGILEETILAIVLVYCPPLHDAFYTTDIDFKMWCYGMPFSFLIWVYDEARKWAIRTERKNNPDWPENKGIVERWTYY